MNKTLMILLICIMTISTGLSQTISESMINFKDSYNPLFAKESAVITMDFIKSYTISQSDTLYNFVIEVSNENIQKEDISLGVTMFNLNYITPSASSSYSINKSQGQSIMTYERFNEFFDCINKVYSFIIQKATFKESQNNLVATCGIENISIGGEYNSNVISSNVTTFYFKMGDETTYEMTKIQFESIIKILRKIKLLWDLKN